LKNKYAMATGRPVRLGVRSAAIGAALAFAGTVFGAVPTYTVDQAVALARKQNPEIAIARTQVEAAHGGVIEARAGFLPAVVSNGLLRERERQESSRLRSDDYNANVHVVQNLFTGGQITSQLAMARLTAEKQARDFDATSDRVAMDVRLAFYELLLNRAKIRVHEQTVQLLEEELKTQQERFGAGTVGKLNVRRAEVALANERPELINAQTALRNSYLHLGELLGIRSTIGSSGAAPFEIAGQLQYQPRHPDLNECLARADSNRPEIKSRQKEIEISEQELTLDRSELRPHVEAFSGYEVYSENDPLVGQEFNHGYVIGLNASWRIFDGFATKGRLKATNAKREAAVHALEAQRLSVASEVRSAFLDLEQARNILEEATKNVQNADESLEIAKGNLGAGLGTQLDTLQAASDVTRTRTTRLSAIYLHNAALARLARACAREPESFDFDRKIDNQKKSDAQILQIAKPPKFLSTQK
jgi:outer membrane protein TolC